MRPSTVTAAIGTGLAVGGLVLLGDLLAGVRRDLLVYPVVGVTAAGMVLAFWHGGFGVLGFALYLWDALVTRRPTPAASPAPASPPKPDEAAEANERAWRLALERFFRAGDAAGSFSIRALEGVVGSDTWARLTDFYCSEAGHRILRVGAGSAGTTWNWGWELDYTLQRLAAGGLPHPAGLAPTVEVYVRNTTRRNAPKRAATVKSVDEDD